MFTLDQARRFIAVAEELHFGRAAARLDMTQQPLSRQVQKLEKALGVELMERDNRPVVLTAYREVLLTVDTTQWPIGGLPAGTLAVGPIRAPTPGSAMHCRCSSQGRWPPKSPATSRYSGPRSAGASESCRSR